MSANHVLCEIEYLEQVMGHKVAKRAIERVR